MKLHDKYTVVELENNRPIKLNFSDAAFSVVDILSREDDPESSFVVPRPRLLSQTSGSGR